ncbi:MAG: ferredoxin [Bacteriovoracaceae bacterium]|jgi:ferredoxin|nr:ferredoxin [Bacteriovoracaceae bacterium]
MADKNSRFDENIMGTFYVDDQCIACDACVMEAPRFFEMNEMDAHAFVLLQPDLNNEQEMTECLNALEACPVEAIGKDGA